MQYDLLIIGSGPAGYVGAVRAAKHGLKTAIIEKETTLGGTCLNWGCIPTKTLLKSAKVIHTIQNAEKYGVSTTGMSFDFAKIMGRKDKVVKRIVKGVDYLMKSNNVDVLSGEASFVDANTVKTPKGNIAMVANGRFLGENDRERGLVKVLTGKQYGELLGLHILAPYASEMITVGTQGIEMEMLAQDFDEIVFPHPTICEAVREAILQAYKA